MIMLRLRFSHLKRLASQLATLSRRAARGALVGVTYLGLTAIAHGFSSGAVDCILSQQNMQTSFHGVGSTGFPYQLNVPPTYVPNVPIEISLTSLDNTSFRGLFLSAATAATSSQVYVGSWTPPSGFSTMAACNGASVTSNSSVLKSAPLSITFVPSALATESLRVSGAVVVSSSQWFAVNTLAINRTPKVLNIDGDASGNPISQDQGLILLRHLLGFTGNSLIDGITHPQATRAPSQITQYLTTNLRAFDVDGDGIVGPSTDALLIVRYLNGLRGTSLLAGAARGALPASEIEARIANLISP
jgi:hypothetical protein